MFFVGHYFVSGFFDSNPLQNTSFENLGFSVLIETDWRRQRHAIIFLLATRL